MTFLYIKLKGSIIIVTFNRIEIPNNYCPRIGIPNNYCPRIEILNNLVLIIGNSNSGPKIYKF